MSVPLHNRRDERLYDMGIPFRSRDYSDDPSLHSPVASFLPVESDGALRNPTNLATVYLNSIPYQSRQTQIIPPNMLKMPVLILIKTFPISIY
jgi:hypothetical protein